MAVTKWLTQRNECMSVSFYPAHEEDGAIRITFKCDCNENYFNDSESEKAGENGYWPEPSCYHCDICDLELNVSNSNAGDLMAWLGMPQQFVGHMKATELAAACRRRLWDESRNHDPAMPGAMYKEPGMATLIVSERRPDYLREQTSRMLKIAEAAGANLVAWS